MMNIGGGWAIDLDIRSFFDDMDRKHLCTLLDQRVRDGVIRRAIGKWMNAGVMEEGEVNPSLRGCTLMLRFADDRNDRRQFGGLRQGLPASPRLSAEKKKRVVVCRLWTSRDERWLGPLGRQGPPPDTPIGARYSGSHRGTFLLNRTGCGREQA